MTTSITPTPDADPPSLDAESASFGGTSPPSLGAGASGFGATGRLSAADDLLRDALQRVWGFSEFRPLQREAMHAILDTRDSIVVLPTGGGKSLCFQAPAVAAGAKKAGTKRARRTIEKV